MGLIRIYDVLPAGKHTKSYGKLPFIVDLPIKHCDFHSYVSLPEGNGFDCVFMGFVSW